VTGELTIGVGTTQVATVAVLVALGGADDGPGQAGLALFVLSWIGLIVVQRRKPAAGAAMEAALTTSLGATYRDAIPAAVRAELPEAVGHREPYGNPFARHDRSVEVLRNISYGDDCAQRLDVYRRRDHPVGCPVLVQVHGGAWTTGQKEYGGVPLLEHLVSRGWVGVAIDHRSSPRATFPDHLVDVKRALAWVRAEGPAFGADPAFVVVAGQSSGGHLATLAACTPNDPRYQPGFEAADTSVAGCISSYGAYDFCDRNGIRDRWADMSRFLERSVMKVARRDAPDAWDAASPIAVVPADAPPFLVIHGTHDSLLWVEEARAFVAALRSTSRATVTYAEIPSAQHAFDIFATRRSLEVAHGTVRWLEHLRATTISASATPP
jgi:acetyl esterase/lipase